MCRRGRVLCHRSAARPLLGRAPATCTSPTARSPARDSAGARRVCRAWAHLCHAVVAAGRWCCRLSRTRVELESASPGPRLLLPPATQPYCRLRRLHFPGCLRGDRAPGLWDGRAGPARTAAHPGRRRAGHGLAGAQRRPDRTAIRLVEREQPTGAARSLGPGRRPGREQLQRLCQRDLPPSPPQQQSPTTRRPLPAMPRRDACAAGRRRVHRVRCWAGRPRRRRPHAMCGLCGRTARPWPAGRLHQLSGGDYRPRRRPSDPVPPLPTRHCQPGQRADRPMPAVRWCAPRLFFLSVCLPLALDCGRTN